ncbi:uncharacterized protein [Diabrotica undecimpunctata]|uniref:uncharacterized protein n=1 Tax=Diabrotica undecimpunctata TaxID=50387 RepID=UPI003B633E5C
MLQIILGRYNPDIICLQETNFKNEKIQALKQFKSYCKNRTSQEKASGGVAIFVKKSIETTEISLQTNLEAICIKLNSSPNIYVCNLYLPSSTQVDSEALTKLLQQIPQPRLILGDFNAHNFLWDSSTMNSRGRLLEEIFEQSNLSVLNDSRPTRFNIQNGESSCIDLTICEPGLTPQLTWDRLDFLYNSDHYPLFIHNNKNQGGQTFTPKWNLKNPNWNLFSNLIESSMTTFKSTPNIEETLENLVTIITKAAEKAIGKTTYIKQRNPVPWWNHECKTAVESSKRAFNQYKRYKTVENKIEYRKQGAIAKKTITNAKRQSWTQYVSTLYANTPMTEVWNKVRRISGLNSNQNIKSLEINGKAVTSNTEIVKILANTYKNRSSNTNYKKSFINYKQQEENKEMSFIPNTGEPLNLPISQLEYTEALSNLKETSAGAGPDDIPSIFIKHLPDSAHK